MIMTKIMIAVMIMIVIMTMIIRMFNLETPSPNVAECFSFILTRLAYESNRLHMYNIVL